jgi:hypothetical protein
MGFPFVEVKVWPRWYVDAIASVSDADPNIPVEYWQPVDGVPSAGEYVAAGGGAVLGGPNIPVEYSGRVVPAAGPLPAGDVASVVSGGRWTPARTWLVCLCGVLLVAVAGLGGWWRAGELLGPDGVDGSAPLPDSTWAVAMADLPPVAAGSVEPPAEGVPGDGPWLWVPSVGVSAPVDAARVRDGVFDPPADPSRVARWADGAGLDGSSGTVLIAGHVAVRGTPGALFDLHRVAPGDLVWTRSDRGTVQMWAVTELRVTSSDDAHSDLFQPADRGRRLALVTCGGDVRAGRYTSNVIVIADVIGGE